MNSGISRTFAALAAAVLLAGCQATTGAKPVGEMVAITAPAQGGPAVPVAAAQTTAAKPVDDDPGPPLEKHEAAAQCWVKVDKQRMGGEAARTAAVDKCIAERLKAGR